MLDRFAHALLGLLEALAGLVLGALVWVEDAAGRAMTQAHIPADLQTILGIILAIAFLVAAFQLLGGFIRVVLIVVLLAIVVHAIGHHLGPPLPPPPQQGMVLLNVAPA